MRVKLARLLRLGIEAEVRDMTRPGDRCPYMLATGRKRYRAWGVRFTPWLPLRGPSRFEPCNNPAFGVRGWWV